MKKTARISVLLLLCAVILSSCSSVFDTTDYRQLTNEVYTKYIEANVAVITNHKNQTSTYDSTGSGVIYREDTGYYYCLTNCHVVDSDPEFPITIYTVIDCYGTEHFGTLVHSDPEYDLAVVKFRKGAEPLYVADIADKDPRMNALTKVVAIGNSNEIKNALTYGEITAYDTVEMRDNDGNDVSLDFKVIHHNAPMWEGGSGGALFSTDMEIIGINFAVATDSEGRFFSGYAISVSKIREYLKKYDK